MNTATSSASTIECKPMPAPPTDADPAQWCAWFESVYSSGGPAGESVPWVQGRAHPCLVSWLNAEAPEVLRPGATVTVVGCGLGHDAAELFGRGYDVLAFDASPAAIDRARAMHPAMGDRFVVADLLALPASLKRRADLVVEISTLQSVSPALREVMAGAIASLARPRGIVLTIARGREDAEAIDDVAGPPFPLTSRELVELFSDNGFHTMRGVDDFVDDQSPPTRRLRAAFRRS